MITIDQIKRYARIAGIIVVAVLVVVGIFSIGRSSRNSDPKTEISVEVDTLFIIDTIFIEKPIPKEIKVIDTLLCRSEGHSQDKRYSLP